jgi:DnaJ-class molecular chaperone
MADRLKEVCGTCEGVGNVVDERQAGEKIATCMMCKGNGWVYSDQKQPSNTVHGGWRASSQIK